MNSKIVNLSKYLIKSIKNDLRGVQKLAICFSGSLDSALVTFIAKKYIKSDITLYTIGYKDCYDFIRAQKTAKILKLDENHKFIHLEDSNI